MGVSENSGTPKSSILIGFSIINHLFWGTTIFGNIHMIFDLVTRPERRHASIMNGSGTESLQMWLADVELSIHMHKNLKNFQKMTNGIRHDTFSHFLRTKLPVENCRCSSCTIQ